MLNVIYMFLDQHNFLSSLEQHSCQPCSQILDAWVRVKHRACLIGILFQDQPRLLIQEEHVLLDRIMACFGFTMYLY